MDITDDSVIVDAMAAGVMLEVRRPNSEHHRTWSVRGVGALALLFWTPEKGFRYQARWGRRWKTYAKGKRLGTVLREIRRDIEAASRGLAQ